MSQRDYNTVARGWTVSRAGSIVEGTTALKRKFLPRSPKEIVVSNFPFHKSSSDLSLKRNNLLDQLNINWHDNRFVCLTRFFYY